MSDEQLRLYIETLKQQIAVHTGKQVAEEHESFTAAFEGLQMYIEQMQTIMEAASTVEDKLRQQNQQLSANYLYYYDLFQSSPLAYLATDAHGVIIKANKALAQLLNVPQPYLIGKPLVVFVAEGYRQEYYTQLNHLATETDVQTCVIPLCPRKQEPFVAQLHIGVVRDDFGVIEALRICAYKVLPSQLLDPQLLQQNPEEISTPAPAPRLQLPQSLDGLQVLIVDDEADVREYIMAVLESHGMSVKAVASASAALEALDQFHPDVLVSDIRMPGGDGYSLIRKVRELEKNQGWHLPAGALTAYLDEDSEKALSAGFEAHLHKLAQPTELIEMVAQLAKTTRASES